MVTLRDADIHDAETYHNLQKSCFPGCVSLDSAQAELEHYRIILAIDHHGKGAGYICFGEERVDYFPESEGGSVFYISNIGVHPEKRGQGISHLLMAACLREAKALCADNSGLVVFADRRPDNLASAHILAAHGLPCRFGVVSYYGGEVSGRHAEIHWRYAKDLTP